MNPVSPHIERPRWADRRDGRPRAVLLGSNRRPHVLDEADRLRSRIEEHVEIVMADFGFQEDLSAVEADFAIVLGGDGSILRAAKQMGANQIPVIGVNLGRLGFLAAVSPDELSEYLPRLVAGNYSVVRHLMFRCTISRGDRVLLSQQGLNEVAILGGPPYSILDIDLYVDSNLVTTYSCDGLIVSTPVGSTAHCLSAGGPILRKNMQAFVVLPISPHTLTMRPVVDTSDRIYEMRVREPNESTSVVVDGERLHQVTSEDRVRVERADPEFLMVEIEGRNDYRTLREKLGWSGEAKGKTSK